MSSTREYPEPAGARWMSRAVRVQSRPVDVQSHPTRWMSRAVRRGCPAPAGARWMSRAGRRLSDEMHHIGYISDRLPRDDPARTSAASAGLASSSGARCTSSRSIRRSNPSDRPSRRAIPSHRVSSRRIGQTTAPASPRPRHPIVAASSALYSDLPAADRYDRHGRPELVPWREPGPHRVAFTVLGNLTSRGIGW